ncbi:MAG TPA: polysaccharide deacetylase family protein [Candidatus Microsaccharimonas sp.]|jgi:peptidoglycan/xylan/chitin deacetylase (PgdA/CDA1 family)
MKKIVAILLCFMLVLPMFLLVSQVKADTINLIANPSVESAANNQPLNFSTNSWGTNTASFTYADGHTGTHGVSVSVSGYSSGDAKWVADKSPVVAGQTYTYTDYYKATTTSELDAEYMDAAGNLSYAYLKTVGPSSTWQQTASTFTVPAGAVGVSVLHIMYSNGTLSTDDYSLGLADQTTVPTTPTTPTNLLANASFETANGTDPASWNRGGYGTNTRTLTYASGSAHTGARSATVALSSVTAGDVKWYADPVAVTAGDSYTYQDSYTSAVSTPVVVAMTDVSGVDSYVTLATAPAASTWAAYTASFTVPAGIKAVTVYHLLNQVGSLTIDDVSLVAGTASTTPTDPTPPTTTNRVANPSFETANGTDPASWVQDSWGTNTAKFSYVTNDGHTGTDSAKITMSNYTDGDAKWYFTPLTTLTPGSQYTYATWYKTTAKVAAVAMYTDAQGVANYFPLPNPLVGASAATSWQSYTANFQVPADAVSMSIFFVIEGNGTLATDDASVTPYTPTGFSEPLISLTFDDGWTSIYDNAFPLLQQYGLVSTQYIISSYIGQPYYMTTAQVQAFQTAGSEIGSHTVDHPHLTSLTAANLTAELSQSQKTLQKDFGTSAALNIASPYGDYNQAVVTAIQKYYQAHRSVDVGFNSKDDFNPYNILVQNITTSTTPADVADWIAQAKATNTWLVIVYHSVTPDGIFDADTTTTAYLDTELQLVKASGIPVKTMTQALAEINAQL